MQLGLRLCLAHVGNACRARNCKGLRRLYVDLALPPKMMTAARGWCDGIRNKWASAACAERVSQVMRHIRQRATLVRGVGYV